ncbi:metallophosphoesterase family protein, partial [Echinicola sediminis]
MRFLHISDLHYKNGFKSDANFKIYKNHLFDKLEEENKKEGFDFVCFSGDLVYGGSESEYEEFNTEFFQPLLSLIDVPLTACCFTPGNHDQDWDQLEAFSPDKLLNSKTNEEFNTLMEKEPIREHLLKSFSAYSEFVNLINPPKEGRVDLGCYWLMEFNNLRVKVNSLNSSFLSKFHYPEGGYGKMRISESQLFSFLKPDPEVDAQIIISHYPIDFFIPSEKMLFENHLMKVGGVYLHGHIHEMSQMKIIDKNHDNGSLLYCPVGPLYTKKEEVGRFSNAFNTISVKVDGSVNLNSYIYTSSPEPKFIPNSYSGKDDGIHSFVLKKNDKLIPDQSEGSNEGLEEKKESLEDIISVYPHLRSLERALEKKILNESTEYDYIINQYDLLAKEVSKIMYSSGVNELRQLRVLAYQFGRQFLYTFLSNKNYFFPTIQYSYIIETLSNLGSETLDYEILEKGFNLLHSNLDFQDPFFEYAGDEDAKIAYECFPFFILALSLISFYDNGEFISRILGVEEAEEENWSSELRKTTFNQYDKGLKFVVTT